MDKKAKKRIEVLQPKLQKLRMQLAGAKKQMDEPGDIERLEAEVAAVEKELRELKES
jgi:peptidoglycan hydrolase CwlO-like protein